MHRFFLDRIEKNLNSIEFNKNQSHQIIKVLRMKCGDKVEIFDGNGIKATVKLDITNNRCTGLFNSIQKVSEQNLKIDMYQSIIKNSKMELAIEKLTEIGINSYTPVISDRVQKNDIRALSNNKIDRLKKISIEASEQSGKFFVPNISKIQNFKEVLVKNTPSKTFIFYEKESDSTYLTDLDLINFSSSRLSVFIGPVGGFSENEINLSKSFGVNIVNLGETVLKSDTAAIISSALIRFLVNKKFN